MVHIQKLRVRTDGCYLPLNVLSNDLELKPIFVPKAAFRKDLFGSTSKTSNAAGRISIINKNKTHNLLVSAVVEFANNNYNDIAIEIPKDVGFDTDDMLDEAMDEANKDKAPEELVFFTVRTFGPQHKKPLTEEEAILKNKKYKALPCGIVVIGSRI